MKTRLSDSELRVMEILWTDGPQTAKALAERLKQSATWSKTTTYTVIQKCIEKGALQRSGHNYLCSPTVEQNQVRAMEAENLVNKLFGGEADLLVASLLQNKKLSAEEIDRLRKVIDELE